MKERVTSLIKTGTILLGFLIICLLATVGIIRIAEYSQGLTRDLKNEYKEIENEEKTSLIVDEDKIKDNIDMKMVKSVDKIGDLTILRFENEETMKEFRKEHGYALNSEVDEIYVSSDTELEAEEHSHASEVSEESINNNGPAVCIDSDELNLEVEGCDFNTLVNTFSNYENTPAEFPSEDKKVKDNPYINLDDSRLGGIEIKESNNEIVVAVIDSGCDIKGNERVLDEIDLIKGKDNNRVHGTRISKLILDNTPSNVKILPIKILKDNKTTTALLCEAIKVATDNGADIINLSLCSKGDVSIAAKLKEAIGNAMSKRIVTICAAGNKSMNTIRFTPANLNNTITVSAVNSSYGFALDYSNYGEEVEYSASGVYSEVTDEGVPTIYEGTSYACAYVSAIAANIKSENPKYGTASMRLALNNMAIDMGNTGRDNLYGRGLLTINKVDKDLLAFANENTEIMKERFESTVLSRNDQILEYIDNYKDIDIKTLDEIMNNSDRYYVAVFLQTIGKEEAEELIKKSEFLNYEVKEIDYSSSTEGIESTYLMYEKLQEEIDVDVIEAAATYTNTGYIDVGKYTTGGSIVGSATLTVTISSSNSDGEGGKIIGTIAVTNPKPDGEEKEIIKSASANQATLQKDSIQPNATNYIALIDINVAKKKNWRATGKSKITEKSCNTGHRMNFFSYTADNSSKTRTFSNNKWSTTAFKCTLQINTCQLNIKHTGSITSCKPVNKRSRILLEMEHTTGPTTSDPPHNPGGDDITDDDNTGTSITPGGSTETSTPTPRPSNAVYYTTYDLNSEYRPDSGAISIGQCIKTPCQNGLYLQKTSFNNDTVKSGYKMDDSIQMQNLNPSLSTKAYFGAEQVHAGTWNTSYMDNTNGQMEIAGGAIPKRLGYTFKGWMLIGASDGNGSNWEVIDDIRHFYVDKATILNWVLDNPGKPFIHFVPTWEGIEYYCVAKVGDEYIDTKGGKYCYSDIMDVIETGSTQYFGDTYAPFRSYYSANEFGNKYGITDSNGNEFQKYKGWKAYAFSISSVNNLGSTSEEICTGNYTKYDTYTGEANTSNVATARMFGYDSNPRGMNGEIRNFNSGLYPLRYDKELYQINWMERVKGKNGKYSDKIESNRRSVIALRANDINEADVISLAIIKYYFKNTAYRIKFQTQDGKDLFDELDFSHSYNNYEVNRSDKSILVDYGAEIMLPKLDEDSLYRSYGNWEIVSKSNNAQYRSAPQGASWESKPSGTSFSCSVGNGQVKNLCDPASDRVVGLDNPSNLPTIIVKMVTWNRGYTVKLKNMYKYENGADATTPQEYNLKNIENDSIYFKPYDSSRDIITGSVVSVPSSAGNRPGYQFLGFLPSSVGVPNSEGEINNGAGYGIAKYGSIFSGPFDNSKKVKDARVTNNTAELLKNTSIYGYYANYWAETSLTADWKDLGLLQVWIKLDTTKGQFALKNSTWTQKNGNKNGQNKLNLAYYGNVQGTVYAGYSVDCNEYDYKRDYYYENVLANGVGIYQPGYKQATDQWGRKKWNIVNSSGTVLAQNVTSYDPKTVRDSYGEDVNGYTKKIYIEPVMEPLSYTLKYYSSFSKLETKTLNYDSCLAVPDPEPRVGYDFIGWKMTTTADSRYPDNSDGIATGALRTAGGSTNDIARFFDGGSEWVSPAHTARYLPTNTDGVESPVKTNTTFKGLGGVTVIKNLAIPDTYYAPNLTVTLEPQWRPREYTLKVVMNYRTLRRGPNTEGKIIDKYTWLGQDKRVNFDTMIHPISEIKSMLYDANSKHPVERLGYSLKGVRFDSYENRPLSNGHVRGGSAEHDTSAVITASGYSPIVSGKLYTPDELYFDYINGTKAEVYIGRLRYEEGLEASMVAEWTPNTYNIEYDYAGGSAGGAMTTSTEYHSAEEIAWASNLNEEIGCFYVPTPTREGYEFAGWKISGAQEGTIADVGIDGCMYTCDKDCIHDEVYGENPGRIDEREVIGRAYTSNKVSNANSYDTFTPITTTGVYKQNYFINLRHHQGDTVKFTATWTPKTYKMKFNTNPSADRGTTKIRLTPSSGYTKDTTEQNAYYKLVSGSADIPFDVDVCIENPARVGYEFIGWEISSIRSGHAVLLDNKGNKIRRLVQNYAGTGIIAEEEVSEGRIYLRGLHNNYGTVVFKPLWREIEYKIEYDLDGGSLRLGTKGNNNPDKADYESWFIVEEPTKTGYTFTGWVVSGYQDKSLSSGNIDTGTVPNGYGFTESDRDVSRYKRINTSGSSIIGSVRYSSNMGVGSNGILSYKNLRINQDSVVKLTATWRPNNYNIIYDLKGTIPNASTTPELGSKAPTRATYDKEVIIDNPSCPGYKFTGWKLVGFDKNTARVYKGGKWQAIDEHNLYKETKYKNLTPIDEGTVKFEANWTPNILTITFDKNMPDSEFSDEHNSPREPNPIKTKQTMLFDSEYKLEGTPLYRYGYTFEGWGFISPPDVFNLPSNLAVYNDETKLAQNWVLERNNKIGGSLSLADGDVEFTMYAIWKPLQYKIVLHGNGNWNRYEKYPNSTKLIGDKIIQNAQYGQKQALPKNVFTRETGMNVASKGNWSYYNEESLDGYTFMGWSKTPNSKTVDFTDKQEVINLLTVEQIEGMMERGEPVEIHLYAVWKKDLTLSFENKTQGRLARSMEASWDIKGVAKSFNMKASVYNNEYKYSFKINGQATSSGSAHTQQVGTAKLLANDEYLVDTNYNGLSQITMSDKLGGLYRYLGLSTNSLASIPNTVGENGCTSTGINGKSEYYIFNNNVRNDVTITNNLTMGLVFEPVLQAQVTLKNSTENAYDNKNIKYSTKTVDCSAVYRDDTDNKVNVPLRQGEEGEYALSIKSDYKVNTSVTFDHRITDIYESNDTDKNAPYYDRNCLKTASDTKLANANQKSNFNRKYLNLGEHQKLISNKFTLPMYLGTNMGYKSNNPSTYNKVELSNCEPCKLYANKFNVLNNPNYMVDLAGMQSYYVKYVVEQSSFWGEKKFGGKERLELWANIKIKESARDPELGDNEPGVIEDIKSRLD